MWSGSNDDWSSLGGNFAPGREIAVVARTPNILHLFMSGNDDTVYECCYEITSRTRVGKDNDLETSIKR